MAGWVGSMIGLPAELLECRGGGMIQSSASECVLVCLLAARTQAIAHLKEERGVGVKEGEEPGGARTEARLLSKLVAYCSKEAHSWSSWTTNDITEHLIHKR